MAKCETLEAPHPGKMTGRVTILTSGPLCRNPRVLKEAGTLGSAGLDVTVVTIARSERFEQVDEQILRGAPFRKFAVDRLGRTGISRLKSFLERGLTAAARRARWQHPTALGPHLALRNAALERPFDLLIAHTELPLCIAADFMTHGMSVAADLEDWHSRDLLPAMQAARPLPLLRRTEAMILRGARHVTTTSGPLADALADTYQARRPAVVPNAFPLSASPSFTPPPGQPSFVWISQTVGPGRGLEQFIAAWSRMKTEANCFLRGEVDPHYRKALVTSVPERVRANLHFQPIVPPDEIPVVLRQHDIGLALEPREPANKDLTISNKVFHYLDAGLALVATPTRGQRAVFNADPAIGLIDDLSSPESLAGRLDLLAGRQDTLNAARAAARRLAEREFSWEKTAPLLLEIVQRSLARKK